MTTAILILITAVVSVYIGRRWRWHSWGSLWRWILCRTIKPLLWRTGLRLVHQDYIDNEVYIARRCSEIEGYHQMVFNFLCECEALQAGGAPSSWFVKEYGDDITKARQHHITQGWEIADARSKDK